MEFRASDVIEKEELAIPKKEDWYVKLTATPNRVFGESVLVAAQMSDQWPHDSEEVSVLKFQDRGMPLPSRVSHLWWIYGSAPTEARGAILVRNDQGALHVPC
ncbi:hypothetical protein Hdeb2414_s0002g00073161 [Helianthus debilis subsp. tardiflorus]